MGLLQRLPVKDDQGTAPTHDGAAAASSSSAAATDDPEPAPEVDLRQHLRYAENQAHIAVENAKLAFKGNMDVLQILEIALAQLSPPSKRTALNSLLTIMDATAVADAWQTAKTNKDLIKDAKHVVSDVLVWRCQCNTKYIDD